MKPDSTPVSVIIPVYRNLAATRRCIESVLGGEAGPRCRLIVIDDASPEPEVADWCEQLGNRDGVTVLRNPQNRGFVATVNRGIEESGDTDVLLLNSDTEVANDWLARMQDCAYSAEAIGTVTPLSNNASVCSYPLPLRENTLPEGWPLAALDSLAARVNRGKSLELPTAVGFCMYIRRACLAAVGAFDEANFGIGYGEECDFSMRARAAGWSNVLCGDVFVYHEGGQSFAGQTDERIRAAEETLHRLHPRYHVLATAFIDDDPVRDLRDALDQGRIEQEPADAVPVVASLRSHRNSLIESRTNRELGLEHARGELQAELATVRASLEETQIAKGELETALDGSRQDLQRARLELEDVRQALDSTERALRDTEGALIPLQQRDGRWRSLLYFVNRLDALYLRMAATRSQP